MNKANHRTQVEDLLAEWVDSPKQSKNVINCLVEFLAGDVGWLCLNISKVDREAVISIAQSLEHTG